MVLKINTLSVAEDHLSWEIEVERVLVTLKGLLKTKKLHYRDMAKALNISEPSVKRLFSEKTITLERLAKVCEWLEISMADFFAMLKNSRAEIFTFTPHQEHFFAEKPHYLAFLYALIKDRSPQKIMEDHGLSKKSLYKYLKKLEELSLVERDTDETIIIKIPSTASLQWKDDGPLGKVFTSKLITGLAEHVARVDFDPKDQVTVTGAVLLTESDIKELQTDLEGLQDKLRERSHLNSKVYVRSKLKYMNYSFIGAHWDHRIFYEISELEF